MITTFAIILFSFGTLFDHEFISDFKSWKKESSLIEMIPVILKLSGVILFDISLCILSYRYLP